jgi:hypothetical protein
MTRHLVGHGGFQNTRKPTVPALAPGPGVLPHRGKTNRYRATSGGSETRRRALLRRQGGRAPCSDTHERTRAPSRSGPCDRRSYAPRAWAGGHTGSSSRSNQAHMERVRPRCRTRRGQSARISSGVTNSQTSRLFASRRSAPSQYARLSRSLACRWCRSSATVQSVHHRKYGRASSCESSADVGWRSVLSTALTAKPFYSSCPIEARCARCQRQRASDSHDCGVVLHGA